MNNPNYKTLKYINGEVEIDVYKIEGEYYLSRKETAKLLLISLVSLSKVIKKSTIIDEKFNNKVKKVYFSPLGKPTYFYPLNYVEKLSKSYNYEAFLKLKNWLDNQVEDVIEIADKQFEIVRFNRDNLSIAVLLSPRENEIWLTENDIAEVYQRDRATINKHINAIYGEGELNPGATRAFFAQVQIEGERSVKRSTAYYNVDMVLAIGYRVNGPIGIMFRNWATEVIKKYGKDEPQKCEGCEIRENVIQKIIQLDTKVDDFSIRLDNVEAKIDKKIETELLFFDGQYFDSFDFICSLVEQSNSNLIVVDSYFDFSGLNILKKVKSGVNCKVILSSHAKLTETDVAQFEKQFFRVNYVYSELFHDRYIIVDDTTCYSIGASLNYIGKKTFSVIKIETPSIIQAIIDKCKCS